MAKVIDSDHQPDPGLVRIFGKIYNILLRDKQWFA
jgi:hypothetical protein